MFVQTLTELEVNVDHSEGLTAIEVTPFHPIGLIPYNCLVRSGTLVYEKDLFISGHIYLPAQNVNFKAKTKHLPCFT